MNTMQAQYIRTVGYGIMQHLYNLSWLDNKKWMEYMIIARNTNGRRQ